MSIFVYAITTPANTAVADKIKTDIKLSQGIIHQLDIVFPPGPQGLCHLTINQALHQRWPSNTDQTFHNDSTTISFKEHLPLLFEPFELQAFTYNLDETYEHEIIIRIGILPVHVLAPWLLPFDERIKAAMGV